MRLYCIMYKVLLSFYAAFLAQLLETLGSALPSFLIAEPKTRTFVLIHFFCLRLQPMRFEARSALSLPCTMVAFATVRKLADYLQYDATMKLCARD